MSSPECITWLAIGLIESVAIVALNIITIIVFIKNRNLRKRSTYLVINLTVADMLAGVVSVYDLFYMLGDRCNVWQSNLSGNWFYVTIALVILFVASSLTNITAISLERLHATLRPFRHRVIKKSVYIITIAIVWVIAGSLSIACVILLKFEGFQKYFFLWSSFNGFCLVVTCVSYSSIVFKVRRGAQPQHHGAASRERKLTTTLFIVTVVSLLCWLPFVTMNFIRAFTDVSLSSLSRTLHLRLENVMIILFFGNSLVNPILYTRMPEFKIALASLFRTQPQQLNRAAVVPLDEM